MAEGEILYLSSVGGFRKRKVKLDPTHPIVVKNHRDHQAHALDERPVHSILKPRYFDTVDDLLRADAPRDPVRVEKWGIICPDNAVWPLSPQGLADSLFVPTKDENEDIPDANDTRALDILRGLKYQEYCEEATQRAVYEGSRSDNKDGYLTTVSFTLGIVACCVLVLIAGVLAFYKWGGAPPVPLDATMTALLLLPLGGLLKFPKVTRRNEAQASPLPKPRPVFTAGRLKSMVKPLAGDAWVDGIIFDHALLGGKIWRARMLYSSWVSVLPESCMFRPDIPKFRKIGALVGAVAVGGICMAVGVQLINIPFGAPLGIPGLIVGAMLGWVMGPRILGVKPIIVASRVPDDNDTRVLVPIEHNYCRTVAPGEYMDNLETVMARINGSGSDDEYEPTIFRATTFYEDIKAQDETAEVTAPSDTLKKVQIGVMAAMAFGSVGLLFFIILATTPVGG